MSHEEVVLQGLPVEAVGLTAPAALRTRLARLAGLAVPPTRGRRLEEPEHLGLALAPHRADQGVAVRIDRGRAGEIRAVEAFQERHVAGALGLRRPARGHDAEDATRLGAVGGRRGEGREAHQRAAACGSQGPSGEFHFILMSRQA